MPPPISSPETFEGLCYAIVAHGPGREIRNLSPGLVELLVQAREGYQWGPTGLHGIAALEASVQELVERGTDESLYSVLQPIADWGGARAPALNAINNYTHAERIHAAELLRGLLNGGNASAALVGMSDLPGIAFVIASKVYRFVRPDVAAAVDRHASYFFNSLQLRFPDGVAAGLATSFPREWCTAAHDVSRMAVYQRAGLVTTAHQYCTRYLPILESIADWLNLNEITYDCPVEGNAKQWRPADIEMAAFFWWQAHGPS